jgi:hypothetical protein
MGFQEIQAAFAAQAAGQPTPAAPTLAPSPFAPLPFQPAAQTPPAPTVQPPAPVQQAFTFTPPAGAPTGPAAAPPGTAWPPINPPGERAPLAAPAVPSAGVQANPTVQFSPADIAAAAAQVPTASAPPEAEPPKRRTRKGAKNAGGMPGFGGAVNLAAEGAAVAQLPADGSTVEDIVQELFARGVSSVHLTFSREDGK